LDKQAIALVCQKHYCLRNELESLHQQYQHHDDLSRSYAGRIKEIQEKLEDLIVNVNQFFCDALDMLESSKVADKVAKPAGNGEF
jgi:hypothetical protein